MIARAFYILMHITALPTWLLGLLLPLAWLAWSAAAHLLAPTPADPGPALHYAWQLKLHASSLLLITLASLIAIGLAVLASYAFARLGRAAVIWAAAAVLVVPPMVYGYLWYLTLGRNLPLPGLPTPLGLGIANLPFLLLAAWSIGLWLWPVPALLIAAGWQWTGRPAWLLARLDTSDLRAFTRAALPAMQPYLLASLAICLLLASQEYAVPALFSVQVWQTQWLALAQAGTPLGKLTLAALPPALVLGACLALLARFWRTIESQPHPDLGAALQTRRSKRLAFAMLLGLLALTAVVPTIGAVLTMPKRLTFSPSRFAPELLDTPIVMALAATLAVAAALVTQLRRRRGLLLLAGFAWALPIGLIAEAARQAQLHLMAAMPTAIRQLSLDWSRLNEQLDILVWVSVLAGRSLPIAWLLLALVTRSLPSSLTEQAAADGATRAQLFARVLLPLLAPAILAAWLVCALLAGTETAAATMLRPPGFDSLAVSLFNQMHYGRDADVLVLCMVIVAVTAIVAAAVAAGLSRTRRDID